MGHLTYSLKEKLSGFFRVETLVMEQEFLWALAWLAVGIILW